MAPEAGFDMTSVCLSIPKIMITNECRFFLIFKLI